MDHPLRPAHPGDDAAARAWAVRFSDPAAMRAIMTEVPDGAPRAVLAAFVAWRESRPDQALTLLGPLLESDDLSALWSVRARSVQAAVLLEIGLPCEARECLLQALEEAPRSTDPIAVAATVHDLGVSHGASDPDRAWACFVEAWTRAHALVVAEEEEPGVDALALEALAVVNLHGLRDTCDKELPEGLPGYAEAEELTRRSWPELSAAIRALRAQSTLAAGDGDEARRLAADLPDPRGMRDVTNAALVAQALARLGREAGHPDQTLATLTETVDRLPPAHALELLGVVIQMHREAGDLESALEAAERRHSLVDEHHVDGSRVAVRALEVWHRSRRAEEQARTAAEVARRLQARLAELNRDRERLRDPSRRDKLTGLWNRRHLDAVLTDLDGAGHQVALVDVDHLKTINDESGHHAGDEALRRLGQVLQDVCGPRDTCARYGGDELVVVRPAGAEGLLAVDLEAATRVRGHDDVGLPEVVSSIGVAWSDERGCEAALERADQLMHGAKRSPDTQLVADGRRSPEASGT
ncbi:diguanylate cyclase domain-containing protein [Arsenicicoccus dermatophilus]|uniref:GGDEF domain-containing protein n=1 Tax=Arsenicicoccus dermatophilus TaxID=1076331 RepID=UPI003917072A